ncbi:valine--tRNA ligase [Candidatus Daviesbacteria bacterium RIFCSPHIGHO2_02_FULL_41_14]|uniref:Valine--tRNA ligase n=1 Tax=Candidatus Daviesbacteria bacterium RIFCSPLOWO2_01_FULL_40_24 TaxID=1797787 RepID=A0A1F5MKG3_9BACT|nr:MAG: valine--tRNA ligase [Candidatus Daviesbacteria bacterium RIFCSPHIGHO2_01_FULL_41_45]OGE34025.1 MAG: valine--tRNA ligase [Candidatus Daviesbacteria bacterium RIFCSPHIGHO2_02_FULL_41_14]OGE65828.1 MAG: valine--tRNA ligase [Candidatus Daviesbacteria bacterium RIFCSPLOWO2_01_FULL_40_24]
MNQKTYSILMPPPNLTGELHLGHAMQHVIMDALARFKRMQGFEVLLLPGVDHAGIQFEGTLNKLLEKEGVNKNKIGREEWLKRAWQFKDQVYQSFHSTWSVFGLSADWEKEVFTLDPKAQKAVLEQFKRFWEKDILYKGAYIVSWCPKCGTAIEDVEMEYEEKKEKLYFVKYKIPSENDECIIVATARPETIYADVAIAIYPNHPKYRKYIGKSALNPLGSKENALMLKIIEDERVEKDFGSGALKITPGHDLLDYQIGKDHSLPILHAIDKSGRMTSLASELEGLKVVEARGKTAQLLEELGALEKIEDYTHSVPICERCNTVVEPLISEEWYVQMQPLAKKALGKISQINFMPQTFLADITNWMENIHDWSISRNLWWGHRIPVWYCQRCNPNHLVGKDQDMIISLEEPSKTCQSCSEKHWIQDEQVLDTWFSSGLWPLATLGWPEQSKDLEKFYPWDFEITGGDIKYLWIARMIILGVWHTDQIPFKNMFFHGMIRDLQGRRFSKSLGNGINPNELRETWGTDATRMALYTYSAPGRDGRASRQTMDERCKNFRNFSTKLKNVYRFIYELKPLESGTESDFSHPNDTEIIQHLNRVIDQVSNYLESYQLHLATEELYDFIWHKFADSYIEWSKKRRADAQPCLEYVFESSLKLLYPFMPFTTTELWQKVGKSESITSSWPKALD